MLDPIPKGIRDEVIIRDGGKCYYCSEKVEHVHHIWGRRANIPKELGDYTGVKNNHIKEDLISLCANHHGMAENKKILSTYQEKISLFKRNQMLEKLRIK